MIDCHSHLTSSDFDGDREAVIARAEAAGVARIAIVGQDHEENLAVLRFAADQPRFLPFIGLHPDRFADGRPAMSPEEVGRIAGAIREAAQTLVGIGEV